jgi:hypothetical protein
MAALVAEAARLLWPHVRDRGWRRWAANYRLGRDRSLASADAALERLPRPSPRADARTWGVHRAAWATCLAATLAGGRATDGDRDLCEFVARFVAAVVGGLGGRRRAS